jgi:5-methylcytosine-specific restriction endonuclease McrA
MRHSPSWLSDWWRRLLGRSRRAYYHAYLHSDAWRRRRRAALKRAGHCCQVCNGHEQLQVHHRTYERLGNEKPGDLTVLCDVCHRLFTKHGRLARP